MAALGASPRSSVKSSVPASSVAARTHSSEERVRSWMTPEPITVGPDATAEEAAKIMLDNGFRHLPIVEGERPIGIISIRSVLRATTEN